MSSMTSHAGCFLNLFLIWSCCYALGILLTCYLHRNSFQQCRLFTVVDNNFRFMFKTETITKLITKSPITVTITKKSSCS